MPGDGWNTYATTDAYRNATSIEQMQYREAWLQYKAPKLYGSLRPEGVSALRQNMLAQNNLPPVLPDEKIIIPDDSLTMLGFDSLETNPALGQKPLAEQLTYRKIWFEKMSAKDEKYNALAPEEQQKLYMDVMQRGPTYASGIFRAQAFTAKEQHDEFLKKDKASQQAESYTRQFLQELGPENFLLQIPRAAINVVTGGKNGVQDFFQDLENESAWGKMVSEADNFIPAFLGSALGLIVSPFGALEKGLAGSMQFIKGTKTAARGVAAVVGGATKGAFENIPGLIEKGVSKLVPEAFSKAIPTIFYNVAGGATAGGLYGISSALSKNQPWDTNLATDASLGVGFEIISRYVSGLVGVKNLLKQSKLKVSLKDFLNAPMDFRGGGVIPEGIAKRLYGDPLFAQFLDGVHFMDNQGGLSIDQFNQSAKGLDIRRSMFGYDVEDTIAAGSKTGEISLKKAGVEVYRSPMGVVPTTAYKATIDWIDNKHILDYYKYNTGTTIYEALKATPPKIQVREGLIVDTASRELTLDFLKAQRALTGFDYTLDPRGTTAVVDQITRTIKTAPTPELAVEGLRKFGLHFGQDGRFAKETLENATVELAFLKAHMNAIDPVKQYYIVDSTTGNLAKYDEIPNVILESPVFKAPYKATKVWSAPSLEVAISKIKKLRQVDISKQAQQTKIIGKENITMKEANTGLIEVAMDIADGNNELNRHIFTFGNKKAATNFLQANSAMARESVFGDTFAAHPELKTQYDNFLHEISKTKDIGLKKVLQREQVPFIFAARMARQNNLYLGYYKGNYIIQEFIEAGSNEMKFTKFARLGEVVRYVNNYRPTDAMGEMLSGVQAGAIQTAKENIVGDLGGTLDDTANPDAVLLKKLDPKKAPKKFGFFTRVGLTLAPPEAAMRTYDDLPVGRTSTELGFSPTAMFQEIRQAERNTTTLLQHWTGSIAKQVKEVSNRGREMATEYWEALDHVNEMRTLPERTTKYKMKADVEAQMLEELGQAETAKAIDLASTINTAFEKLFSALGIDKDLYIRHYLPHLRDAAHRSAGSLASTTPLDDIMRAIPKQDRQKFFDFIRAFNVEDAALEKDIGNLAVSYFAAAAQKMTLDPVLTKVRNFLEKTLKKSYKGAQEVDYLSLQQYMKGVFKSLKGSADPSDLEWDLAAQATYENVAKKLNRPVKRLGSVVDRILAITTGGYIAYRPYSVGKQILSSMFIGMPALGPTWWMAGLQAFLEPGTLKRLIDEGVIKPGQAMSGLEAALKKDSMYSKLLRVGMAPFSWGDNFGRAVSYLGMQKRVNHYLDKLVAKQITEKQFIHLARLDFFGREHINTAIEFLRIKNVAVGREKFTHYFSQLMADKTNFLYGKLESPQIFKRGAGRFFGQFVNWSNSYIGLIKDIWVTDTMPVASRIRMLAEVGGVAAAIGYGMQAVGINDKSMLPWNMALIQGGPYYTMMNDLLGSIAGGDETRFPAFARALVALIPFSRAQDNVMKAVAALVDRQDPWMALVYLSATPLYVNKYANKIDTPFDVLEKKIMEGGKMYFKGKEQADSLGGIFPK